MATKCPRCGSSKFVTTSRKTGDILTGIYHGVMATGYFLSEPISKGVGARLANEHERKAESAFGKKTHYCGKCDLKF